MFVLLEGAACHKSKVNIHCDSDVIGSSGNSQLMWEGYKHLTLHTPHNDGVLIE